MTRSPRRHSAEHRRRRSPAPPTSTGATAASSVGGRAATSQGSRGGEKLPKVGLALLVEGVAGPPALPSTCRRAAWRRRRTAAVGRVPSPAALIATFIIRIASGDCSRSRGPTSPPRSRNRRAGPPCSPCPSRRPRPPVLATQVPDLACPLVADHAGEQTRPVAAVERPHLGTGLSEHGIVGGDGGVAHQVEDVSAADGVPATMAMIGLGTGASGPEGRAR